MRFYENLRRPDRHGQDYALVSPRPTRLEPATVDAWLAAHPGWARASDGAIARTFAFADFASALAFAVRVGCYAERRDHHPDLDLGWGRARVLWSTHDAGGVTELDLDAAAATDAMHP
jgi:4a-hydroxytetrahydrobiopterin dehydratase